VYRGLVRALWSLCLSLGACSFAPTATLTSGPIDSGGSGTHDGSIHDAKLTDGKVFDDACIDSDHDGVCDSVEWPCAPTLPAPVQSQITMSANPPQSGSSTPQTVFIIDNATVNGVTRLVAAHGVAATIALHYDITDTACPVACQDQIEIGWVAGDRSGCLIDTPINGNVAATISNNTVVRFPQTPGAYDLRVNIGQNFSCDHGPPGVTTNGWWKHDPGDNQTIARVCVQ